MSGWTPPRCAKTASRAFDPDTLAQDTGVLRRIQTEFGGTLALNCYVVRGGTLRVGDPVELLDVLPEHLLPQAQRAAAL